MRHVCVDRSSRGNGERGKVGRPGRQRVGFDFDRIDYGIDRRELRVEVCGRQADGRANAGGVEVASNTPVHGGTATGGSGTDTWYNNAYSSVTYNISLTLHGGGTVTTLAIGEVGAPLPGLALDEGIVRRLWLDADEIQAADREGRTRSALVWQCVQDHQAGQRHPLSLLHCAESLWHPERYPAGPA